MDRRQFINTGLTVGALTIAGGLGIYLAYERVPDVSDVDEVARYINRNIAEVSDHKDNGGNLVYYFPDIHTTSVHRRHLRIIKKLGKKFGLDDVGIEGPVGIVGEGEVKKEADLAIESQKKGEFSQLALNEEKFHKKPLKKIFTLDDFLQVSPLYQLGLYGSGFNLYGLDNLETNVQLELAESLKKSYESYYNNKRKLFEIERDQKSFPDKYSEESIRRFSELLKFAEESFKKSRKEMDEVQKRIETFGKFSDYDAVSSRNRSFVKSVGEEVVVDWLPFHQDISRYTEWLLVDKRSEDAVEIVKNRQRRQIAMIYVAFHKESIISELNKSGLSYIVI